MTTADDDLLQRERVPREPMLHRFNRLMSNLARGAVARDGFEPWEVEILLDIKRCKLEWRLEPEVMSQYRRAVERQLKAGPGPPMKLSHFLIMRAREGGESD